MDTQEQTHDLLPGLYLAKIKKNTTHHFRYRWCKEDNKYFKVHSVSINNICNLNETVMCGYKMGSEMCFFKHL